MSGPAVVACLVLTGALVLAGIVLLARSARRDDPTADLLGLMVLIGAGVPAAVYGAASG